MGRKNAEVSLRVTLPLLLLLGACGSAESQAPKLLSAYDRALAHAHAGRFDEALALLDESAPARLVHARILYSAHGPSLGDPAAALKILAALPGAAASNATHKGQQQTRKGREPTTQASEQAEARLALDPTRDEPLAAEIARVEAKCRIRRCREEEVADLLEDHGRERLMILARAGRLFFPLNSKRAGDAVAEALALQKKLQAEGKSDIGSLHWIAAVDELYADVLAGNRHYGHARGLYLKALAAYRYWPAQSSYSERRKKELEAKVILVDRALFTPVK